LLRVIDEALLATKPSQNSLFQADTCVRAVAESGILGLVHVLIQGTLAEGLSVSRRVRWHARIDEALEELYGVDVEAHAAELAYHFAEAVTVSGLEKLVRYSVPSVSRRW
jgi:hypothetical protein